MIYLSTEDEHGGLRILQYINEEFAGGKCIVKSFNGISYLVSDYKEDGSGYIDYLVDILTENDLAIVVVDRSPENRSVELYISEAIENIESHNLSDKIHLISIVSFEFEILSTLGIKEFIINTKYDSVIDAIQDRNKSMDDIKKTLMDNDDIYRITHNKCVKHLNKLVRRGSIDSITEESINSRINIETLSKTLYNLVFVNTEIKIDTLESIKKFYLKGTCWDIDCCNGKVVCRKRKYLSTRDKRILICKNNGYSKVSDKVARNSISKMEVTAELIRNQLKKERK